MKKWILAVLSAAVVFTLSACGGGSNTASGPELEPTQEIVIVASNFQFDQEEYRVKKGEPVRYTLENAAGVHGIEIVNAKVKLMKGGESKVAVINKPGEYRIICNIPCGNGHVQMVSKLIVE